MSHSTHDVMNQFKNAMLDRIGYAPETTIGDGRLHRVKDESGKLNGAYALHLDGRPAGYFEDFKQGIKERWKMDGDIEPPTAAERVGHDEHGARCQRHADCEAEQHRQRGAAAGAVDRSRDDRRCRQRVLLRINSWSRTLARRKHCSYWLAGRSCGRWIQA